MPYCVSAGAAPEEVTGCFDANFAKRSSYQQQIARVATLIHDAFDGRPKGDNPNNADAWQLTPGSCQNGIANTCTSTSLTPYGDIKDEKITLKASSIPWWIRQFIDHANAFNALREDPLLTGLADVMRFEGNSWCNICQLYALHSEAIASNIRDTWNTCLAAPIGGQIGPPPEASLRLSAGSCQPCPPRSISNLAGECVPCGAREVVDGNTCSTCSSGTVVSGNACSACPDGSVTVGNTCVACAPDQVANHESNTCVTCPADDELAASALVANCSTSSANGPVAGDICPARLVVNVPALGTVSSTAATGVTISASPSANIIDAVTCRETAVTLSARVADGAWQTATSTGEFHPEDCGVFCVPASCTFAGTVRVPRSGLGALKVIASASNPTSPSVGSAVLLTLDGVTCGPPIQ